MAKNDETLNFCIKLIHTSMSWRPVVTFQLMRARLMMLAQTILVTYLSVCISDDYRYLALIVWIGLIITDTVVLAVVNEGRELKWFALLVFVQETSLIIN